MTEHNTKPAEKKKGRGEQRDFPILPLSHAIDVARVIDEKLGGRVGSYETLATAINVHGGALIQRVAAARRYGLIEGKGEMKPTQLAMKILHPIGDGEAKQGMKEAIHNVAIFKEMIDRFGAKAPENEILQNILKREYSVPHQILPRVAYAIRKNIELLGAGEDISTPKESEPAEIQETQLPSKVSSQLTISFIGNVHKFDISTNEDWEVVNAIVKSLKSKWEAEEKRKK